MTNSDILLNFSISFSASLLGIIVVLFIEKRRLPRIIIKVEEGAHFDLTYGADKYVPGRAKHFRIIVQNENFPWFLSWITRQTAINCSANIYFKGINNNTNFSFKGRWPSTPQLPMISDPMVKIISPDPVNIMAGQEEMLDIFSKFENDKEAYGWNNESYFNKWRVHQYKLVQGNYEVKVEINTQNGTSQAQKFNLTVADTIEKTILS